MVWIRGHNENAGIYKEMNGNEAYFISKGLYRGKDKVMRRNENYFEGTK